MAVNAVHTQELKHLGQQVEACARKDAADTALALAHTSQSTHRQQHYKVHNSLLQTCLQ
jgi:hypothetical protein